jgi:hypothetical protein
VRSCSADIREVLEVAAIGKAGMRNRAVVLRAPLEAEQRSGVCRRESRSVQCSTLVVQSSVDDLLMGSVLAVGTRLQVAQASVSAAEGAAARVVP